MQAVVLCGGRGTRLQPLTDTIPKVMIDINGRPFLERLLLLLKEGGISRALLCTGYLADKIRGHFGDGTAVGMELSYSREETPLDTAGALKNAFSLLEHEFLVLNGDTYCQLDYPNFSERFRLAGTKAMVAAYGNQDAIAGNNLRVEGGMVVEYNKDSQANMTHVDAGVLAMRRGVVEGMPDGKVSLEREVYPILVSQRQLSAYVCPRRFYDMGTMESLGLIREFLK